MCCIALTSQWTNKICYLNDPVRLYSFNDKIVAASHSDPSQKEFRKHVPKVMALHPDFRHLYRMRPSKYTVDLDVAGLAG